MATGGLFLRSDPVLQHQGDPVVLLHGGAVQEWGGAGEAAVVVDVLLLPEPLLLGRRHLIPLGVLLLRQAPVDVVPGGAEARLAQDPPRQGLQVGHASPVRRPPFNCNGVRNVVRR